MSQILFVFYIGTFYIKKHNALFYYLKCFYMGNKFFNTNLFLFNKLINVHFKF